MKDIYPRIGDIFVEFTGADKIEFYEEFVKKDLVTYDLRLGEEVYLSSKSVPMKLSEENPDVVLEPGDFALLQVYEYVKMPSDLLGFISLRFSVARRGLVNISGFHVDPEWEGKIIFAVHNAGPNEILLRFKDRIFILFFSTLVSPVREKHSGNYPTLKHIDVNLIQGLRGGPISIRNLDRRLLMLEERFRLFLGIIGGLATAVIAALIAFLLHLI